MNRFLKSDKFDTDPYSPTASQEWNYWLKAFETVVALCEDLDDTTKLGLLINHASYILYQRLVVTEKETYNATIETLNAIPVKPDNFSLTYASHSNSIT